MGKRSDSESRQHSSKKHRHRRKEVYQNTQVRRLRISNFDRPPQPLEIQRVVTMYESDGSIATDLELTKHARKIFIGNISSSCSEDELRSTICQILTDYGGIIKPGDPIISTLFLPELRFMFIEFRTIEETEAALTLDGLELNGKCLKIRRPADYYNNETPHSIIIPRLNVKKVGIVSPFVDDHFNKILVGGLHPSLEDEQIMEILEAYGELKGFVLMKEPVELQSLGYAFCEYVNPVEGERACLALNGSVLFGKTLVVRRVISSQYEQELVETSLGKLRGEGPDFSLITQYPGGCIQPNFETIMFKNRPITVAEFIKSKHTIEVLQHRAKELAQERAKREAELFASGVGPPGLEYDHRLYEDIPGLSGLLCVTGNLFPSLNYMIHPDGSSNIVRIEGMVDPQKLLVDAEYTRMYDEIMEELTKYGTVVSLIIPRQSEGYFGECIGIVYVEYIDVSSAVRSSSLIAQRVWKGKQITSSYFDAIKFMRNELS